MMNRRESRESAFTLVFSMSENGYAPDEILADLSESCLTETDEFSEQLLNLTYEHLYEIDALIHNNLKGWSIERISRVSLAVLRISCAQLLYLASELSPSVVINEAVELAKKFGADDDYSFVNGALRGIYEQLSGQQEPNG